MEKGMEVATLRVGLRKKYIRPAENKNAPLTLPLSLGGGEGRVRGKSGTGEKELPRLY